VARQLPLQRSPEMIPLHQPAPELPTSRPLPLATERPTDTLTDTTPRGLTPPVTLPPRQKKPGRRDTAKGKLLFELHCRPVMKTRSRFHHRLPTSACLCVSGLRRPDHGDENGRDKHPSQGGPHA